MLADTAWLRQQLRIALAVVPLALGACDDAGAQPAPPRFPPCPSGDFCSTADKVKSLAKDKTTSLGCPTELSEHVSEDKDIPRFSGAHLDEAATKKARKSEKATDCCYHWYQLCPGGRPLLDDGNAVVATARGGDSWGGARALDVAPALRDALGAGWRADALAEHASIASFARATLELMALGAPPDLIAETQRASLDEIEHARAAFALAARYGQPIEPGALPLVAPRDADPVRLARDVFLEGCVGETIAALCATRAAAGCADPELAATLRRIADDEARHAALAWKTLAWTGRAADVVDLVAALRETDVPEADPLADALAAHGRLDTRALAIARRDALRDIIEPMLASLV